MLILSFSNTFSKCRSFSTFSFTFVSTARFTMKESTLTCGVLDFFLKCSLTGNLWVNNSVQFEEVKFQVYKLSSYSIQSILKCIFRIDEIFKGKICIIHFFTFQVVYILTVLYSFQCHSLTIRRTI